MINAAPTESENEFANDFELDLTPMLDILFILLVFFILTAGTVFQSLDLTLPQSVSKDLNLASQPDHILVELRRQGYGLNGQKIDDFTNLKTQLAEAVKNDPDHELIVAGDKEASIERLLEVLTYLQTRGIKAANILMKRDASK